MAIKYGTSPTLVQDVVWVDSNNANHIVTAIKLNDTFVYARPSVYTTGTLPLGIQSLSASRAEYLDPHATTGLLSEGAAVYHGDQLQFTASASNSLWLAVCDTPSTELNFQTNRAVTGVVLSQVHGVAVTRSVVVSADDHVFDVGVQYYTHTDTPASAHVGANQSISLNVSAPYTVSWSAIFDEGWTGTVSGSSDPSTTTYNVFVESRRLKFTVTVQPGTHTIVDLSYYSNATTIVTDSISSTTAYETWPGKAFTYRQTPARYWTITDTQEHAQSIVDDITIVGENARPIMGDIIKDHPITCQISYTDAQGSSQSYTWNGTSTGSISTWVGATINYVNSVSRPAYWAGELSGQLPPVDSGSRTIPQPVPIMRTITVSPNAQATALITYTDVFLTSHTVSQKSSKIFTLSAAAPYSVTTSVTPEPYWNASITPNINPGTSAETVAVNVERKTRNIILTKNTHVSAISLTYYDGSNVSHTVTSAGTYAAWCGQQASWTATADFGYTMSASSGTIAVEDTDASVNVNPTATALVYTLQHSWTQPYGSLTFHASEADANANVHPLSAASYDQTVWVRQQLDRGYFDTHDHNVEIYNTTVGSSNWTNSGNVMTFAPIYTNVYYKLTLKNYNRGAIYNNTLPPTEVLSYSLGSTNTTVTYVQNGQSFYAPFLNANGGSTSSNAYAFACDNYTAGNSAWTFQATNDVTQEFNGQLRLRNMNLMAGPDNRLYEFQYCNAAGATTLAHIVPGAINSANQYVIQSWKGQAFTYSFSGSGLWSVTSYSETIPVGTRSFTISRSSTYQAVKGTFTHTATIAGNASYTTTLLSGATAFALTSPSATASITTTASGTTHMVNWTVSMSGSNVVLQARNTNKTAARILECTGTAYNTSRILPPTIYRRQDVGQLVLYNPNNLAIDVYGWFSINGNGGSTSSGSVSSLQRFAQNLGSGQSITVGSTSIGQPGRWFYSMQSLDASNENVQSLFAGYGVRAWSGRIANLFSDSTQGRLGFDGSLAYNLGTHALHVSGTFYLHTTSNTGVTNWVFPITSLTAQIPDITDVTMKTYGLMPSTVRMYDVNADQYSASTYKFKDFMGYGPLVYVDQYGSVQIRRLYDLNTGDYGAWEWNTLYHTPVVVDVTFYLE